MRDAGGGDGLSAVWEAGGGEGACECGGGEEGGGFGGGVEGFAVVGFFSLVFLFVFFFAYRALF